MAKNVLDLEPKEELEQVTVRLPKSLVDRARTKLDQQEGTWVELLTRAFKVYLGEKTGFEKIGRKQ